MLSRVRLLNLILLQTFFILMEVSSRSIVGHETKLTSATDINQTKLLSDVVGHPRLTITQEVVLRPQKAEAEVLCNFESGDGVDIRWMIFADLDDGVVDQDFLKTLSAIEKSRPIQNFSTCQLERRGLWLVPGKEMFFFDDCLVVVVVVAEVTEPSQDGRNKTVLNFKLNQSSECQDKLLAYQSECNVTRISLDGLCIASNESTELTTASFFFSIAEDYFEVIQVTESAPFFGYHRSFWTNSSEQRRRYNREFQKCAGFIAGMCFPFVILLYMSFYLTCFKNSGNHDANMFGSDKM